MLRRRPGGPAFWTNPPASFKLTDWNFSLRNYEELTRLNGLNDATDPDLSAFAAGVLPHQASGIGI